MNSKFEKKGNMLFETISLIMKNYYYFPSEQSVESNTYT